MGYIFNSGRKYKGRRSININTKRSLFFRKLLGRHVLVGGCILDRASKVDVELESRKRQRTHR